MDPPFTRLDILLCRNLLIYLTPELQKKLIPLFHYSLNPGGTLFLGSAETVSNFTDLFAPQQAKSRLFIRHESVLQLDPVVFPAALTPAMPNLVKEPSMPQPAMNLQSLADQLLLQHYSPPAALTTNQGDVLYINGRTGKYLEPAAGKANWNIFAMAREGLRFELTGAFQKAVRNKESLTVKGCKVGTNGGTQIVDLIITPLNKPAELQGMVMIVFRDVTTPPAAKKGKRIDPSEEIAAKIAELEEERDQGQEELQALREGMQGSQEELKSMNEELQSTNEELQSTNEELTTSKEELQSMNEELQTVNAEQSSKMNELGQINNDMKNLLNSTEIITLFLDNDLHVQRFTTGANKIFKLLPGDVGRALTDITNTLHYPELTDDAMEVLRSLTSLNKEVATNDGGWYLVRTMPYRTLENVIDGVVLTFTDITSAKQQEEHLEETESMFHSLVEVITDVLICLSPGGKILEINPMAESLLNCKKEDVIGKNYFALYESAKDPDKAAETMQKKLAAESGHQLTTELALANGTHLSLKWTASKLSKSQTGKFGVIIMGQVIPKEA